MANSSCGTTALIGRILISQVFLLAGVNKFAQKIDPQRIRWLVIAIGFGMSLYFFIRR